MCVILSSLLDIELRGAQHLRDPSGSRRHELLRVISRTE